MSSQGETTKNENKATTVFVTTGSHLIIIIFALFLAWNCNKDNKNTMIKVLHMAGAFLCPQCYILYTLIFNKQCIFCNAHSSTGSVTSSA